jgi:hypothetical protein
METLTRFFFYYQLLILFLLPIALFALWVIWLEREKPHAYLRLATITVVRPVLNQGFQSQRADHGATLHCCCGLGACKLV